MARQYRYTWLRRVGNGLMKAAVKQGFGPRKTWLLTVQGRKTGREYTTPVNLVERDGTRYLVSPYGERSWVQNARAAGEVTLRRGRRAGRFQIEELGPDDAAPVLADYWRRNAITRPFFEAGPDAGKGFLAEGRRHPVFRLSVVGSWLVAARHLAL
jgi:deazaflavin-dependent oxidoreductase (nitroreductase family)